MEQNKNIEMDTNRYFTFDDDGNRHWVVARDLQHVHVIFDGIEFGYPSRSLGESGIEIKEVDAARASKVITRDDNGADPRPLTGRDAGDWFCTEH